MTRGQREGSREATGGRRAGAPCDHGSGRGRGEPRPVSPLILDAMRELRDRALLDLAAPCASARTPSVTCGLGSATKPAWGTSVITLAGILWPCNRRRSPHAGFVDPRPRNRSSYAHFRLTRSAPFSGSLPASYAAQQAAEKAVKALRLLLGTDKDDLKTHAMLRLLGGIPVLGALRRAHGGGTALLRWRSLQFSLGHLD